jgi:hypothetical protein
VELVWYGKTREGGTVAGNARRELERKSGRKVVTSDTYLSLAQSVKKVQPLANDAAIKPDAKKP